MKIGLDSRGTFRPTGPEWQRHAGTSIAPAASVRSASGQTGLAVALPGRPSVRRRTEGRSGHARAEALLERRLDQLGVVGPDRVERLHDIGAQHGLISFAF